MRNVLLILKRDFLRILKVPGALIVLLFLMILPSFYTWFNMVGFWDPYENTGNLRVCVVNEDAGCANDTLGELNLGDAIVEQLENNHQLGWVTMDNEQAQEEILAGEACAVLVIPEDFSSKVAALVDGNLEHPTVEYYVNEKLNPITPKVTDTGASTLETTINDQFVATASSVVTSTVDSELGTASDQLNSAQENAVQNLTEVLDSITAARTSLDNLSSSMTTGVGKVSAAQKKVDSLEEKIDASAEQLDKAAQLASDVGVTASKISSELSASSDTSSLELTQAAANAQLAVAHAAAAVETANVEVNSALRQAKAVTEANDELIASLEEEAAVLPDGDVKDKVLSAISNLKSKNNSAKSTVSDLETAAASIKTTADSLSSTTSQLINASVKAVNAGKEVRDVISQQAIPALITVTAQIQTACGDLKTAIMAQKVVAKNLSATLGNLETTLSVTASTVSNTSQSLDSVEKEVDTLRSDVAAIGLSESLSKYLSEGGIDSSKIAKFMGSPTSVKLEALYPVEHYGSAMAPLLINLTLWIGALMLVVILKVEVDGENLPELSTRERYFGRGLFMMFCSIMQAIVCCIGCVYLGIQLVSMPLFFLTTILIAISYMAIQFALTTSFQHVGKGMIIVCAFIQIPAATGLYPVEMTTQFFRTIYPAFPFTYGINAIREVVCGFYGNTWVICLAVLAGFAIVFTVAALLAQPYLINLNRLFARQIKETEIINGESAQQPARRYRLSKMLLAITDIDEYNKALDVRLKRFMRFYPMMRLLVFGLTGLLLVLSTVVLHFLHVEKVLMLTVWVCLLFAMALALIFSEYTYNSLSHEVSVKTMSTAEISALMAKNASDRRVKRREKIMSRRNKRKEETAEQEPTSETEGEVED